MIHRRNSRNIFYLLCVILGLSILLILDRKLYYNYLLLKSLKEYGQDSPLETISIRADNSPNIENILKRARTKIRHDLLNYNFSYSNVDKIEDLLLEHGGKPIRSMIVSAWRSGSTFFGELLNAMPSNFYHYEPLLKYQIKQIRGPPYAAEATRALVNMFHCNYSGMEDYFEYGKQHLDYLNQFKHNTRLWEQCKERIELCFDADFTGKFCRLFPFQSMKVVRFRLQVVEDILADKRLNVKVVLLVRDPRGLLQSRRYRTYCQLAPDCIEPALVCSDMVSDYRAAGRLMHKYPGRVMVLRYEDLALNLNKTTRQLQQFLHLAPTQAVDEFLYTHTNAYAGGIDATFRVTQDVPFKWKKILKFEYINKIQDACKEAMSLWGYEQAHSAHHMESEQFFPLLPYSVDYTKEKNNL